MVTDAIRLCHEGIYHHQNGEHEIALACFKQALEILTELKAAEVTSLVLHNIGLVYHSLHDYDKALAYYHRVLAQSPHPDNLDLLPVTLNNIGLVYHTLGKYKKALSYYQQALEYLRIERDTVGQIIARYNMAMLCKRLNDLTKAQANLQKADKLVDSLPAVEFDKFNSLLKQASIQLQSDSQINIAGEHLAVLIVAQPGRLRDGLQTMVKSIPMVTCVTQIDDGQTTLRSLTDRQPTLLLLDANLPNGEAWSLLAKIKTRSSQIRCIAMVDNDRQRKLAYAAGAVALLKGFQATELSEMIFNLFPQHNEIPAP